MKNFNLFTAQGLKHGGRIDAAVAKYGIAKKNWLDLSTGLNPNGWLLPSIPDHIWQGLPEDNDGLQLAAFQYYGGDMCLPIAGSQAAIQMLPYLRSISNVGVLSPTYAEHEYNWRKAGHNVIELSFDDINIKKLKLDVLIIVNPNNPTGKCINKEQLLLWQQQLAEKEGWLIVDEAFIDVIPEKSILNNKFKSNLIVLRSMGKFFGLAGMRCGFIFAEPKILQALADKLGPWSLSGPTRYVAKRALQDISWILESKNNLLIASKRLYDLLNKYNLEVSGGTALFQWVEHLNAKSIYTFFAEQGILLRYFEENISIASSLRFGLPAKEEQWQRLEDVLKKLLTTKLLTIANKKETSCV